VISAACFLLAAKINEPKGESFSVLIDALARGLEVDARDVYGVEFETWAGLEFSLFLPEREVLPHLERIIGGIGAISLSN
jgi:hypothetical protein